METREFTLFCLKMTYFKGKVSKKEIFPPIDSIPNWPYWLGLGKAETRNLDSTQVSKGVAETQVLESSSIAFKGTLVGRWIKCRVIGISESQVAA